ncbi:MAG: putative beta-lysine N-acetyltransferase [Marinilabiliaceae bacterium]|nr:putative beta-lysine N-acetyltransferase [Marinilabiliaceae bacterium]
MNDKKGGMKMSDVIENVGKGSKIQHGKLNDRVYLMKLDREDIDTIINKIQILTDGFNYSKVICKISRDIAPLFLANDYRIEAYIPDFFNANEDMFFMSKFLSPERLLCNDGKMLAQLSQLLMSDVSNEKNNKKDLTGYSVRKMNDSDADEMAQIYGSVFESYPFPIHDPEYIIKTMNGDVQYFGVEKNGSLVALSSAEIDFENKNAEMTDFATIQSHLGKSLAGLLLRKMEKEMKHQCINTLYTIARLNSIPMNKTFIRNNYNYSGSLINNTNISGEIESMNIYYKHI